jgi:hypothetical protein
VRPNTFGAPPLSASELGGGAPVGEAPKELRTAYFLWLGVAFLLIVAAVLTLTLYSTALDDARQANSGLTDEQLRTGVAFFIGVFVVIDAVFVGLFVLFAIKLKAGRSWARTWLMILGPVAICVQLVISSWLALLVLTGLLIIGGVVLMNLRPSSEFLTAQRAA